MEAREHISGEVLIVYSDIIFDNSVLTKVIESKSDIAIAVDMNWEKAYENRTEHTTSEAENTLIEKNKIVQILKHSKNGPINVKVLESSIALRHSEAEQITVKIIKTY